MCSEKAIQVRQLSKCFHIYEKPHQRLLQMIWRRPLYKPFWALRDISFDVSPGETVGIVGRNGSGKSTLLQLICGTLTATSGSIVTHGRIAALLELGSGFNPEFTGRENVFMNAAVLGLSEQETRLRFEAIAEFAEIGDFIDQPVKTYSSGMMIRLAFAVAINVDAQILIIDEALAVGDELFQRKCYGRIETLKQQGVTILFVSHSGGTVIEFCDRAMLLDQGELLALGTPKEIVGCYQRLIYAPLERRLAIRAEISVKANTNNEVSVTESVAFNAAVADTPTVSTGGEEWFDPDLQPLSTITYESQGALIDTPWIENEAGLRVNCLITGRRYVYRYPVRFTRTCCQVRFGMMIKTTTGFELGGSASHAVGQGLPCVQSGETHSIAFTFDCQLNPGTYFLNAGVTGLLGEQELFLHRVMDACLFRVLPVTGATATGVVDFSCRASCVFIEP